MRSMLSKLDLETRREFVRTAAKTFLGVGALPLMSQTVRGETNAAPHASSNGTTRGFGQAKSVIYIYLSGGMSHIDTFDPKPGAETQGPVETRQTNVPGIAVSEYLPRMARQMEKVAVINSLSSTRGAHAPGRYFMHTSYFLRGTIQHPDLGAYSAKFLEAGNPLLPKNVKIGGNSSGLGAGFLESKFGALPIGDPASGLQHSASPPHVSDRQYAKRIQRLQKLNREFARRYDVKSVRAYGEMYVDAVKLMSSKDLVAFDISKESDTTREAYGDHQFGQGLLLARRLAENGVTFIEVDDGGWDTHTENFDRLEEKAAVLDQSLAQLIADLADRGLLDSTLVVLATEFGRTPDIVTGNNGRNHYPKAFSGLLAGGGIQAGIRYGKTDDEGREVIEDEMTVPDFNATIAHALGLPLEQKIMSPSMRPFHIAADGKPRLELFS